MTLDDLRSRMNSLWASANRETDELKDPIRALERLSGLYRNLDATERELADRVLAEWVLSHEEAKRFDAVALIREFEVTSAAPELRDLVGRLARSDDPGAPFEREKVEVLLRDLGLTGGATPRSVGRDGSRRSGVGDGTHMSGLPASTAAMVARLADEGFRVLDEQRGGMGGVQLVLTGEITADELSLPVFVRVTGDRGRFSIASCERRSHATGRMR